MGLWTYFKEIIELYRCKHYRVQMVYGDEINYRGGYRWKCADCGATIKQFKSDQDYKLVK